MLRRQRKLMFWPQAVLAGLLRVSNAVHAPERGHGELWSGDLMCSKVLTLRITSDLWQVFTR
jgi:hypothetical protein